MNNLVSKLSSAEKETKDVCLVTALLYCIGQTSIAAAAATRPVLLYIPCIGQPTGLHYNSSLLFLDTSREGSQGEVHSHRHPCHKVTSLPRSFPCLALHQPETQWHNSPTHGLTHPLTHSLTVSNHFIAESASHSPNESAPCPSATCGSAVV
jgi:hypothetical protein